MGIKLVICILLLLHGSIHGLFASKNIMLIMVDDMRFDQMSGVGHPYIETPNLDALVAEGISFSRAYVTSPVCGPSRASLYTARLPSDHQRYNNFLYGPDLEPYLPDTFRAAGYRTAMIGKFYERPHRDKEAMSHRFDRWFESSGPDMSGYKGASNDGPAKKTYYSEHMYYDQKYRVDGVEQVISGHQTDVLFAEATRFIGEQTDKPFMVLLHPFAPHSPFNPSERNLNRYQGEGIPERPNQAFEAGWFGERNELQNFEHVSERMCEMLVDVDEALGALIAEFKINGQLDNTIIVFTSDNGMQMGEHGFGWKRHPWEESIRVPLIIYDSSGYGKGVTQDALVSIADLFPTLADAANVKLPKDPKRYGRSFLDLLHKGESLIPREHVVIEQYPQDATKLNMPMLGYDWVALIRADGWKYFDYPTEAPRMRLGIGRQFLFNLDKDPYEKKNEIENPEYQATREHLEATLGSLSRKKF